MIFSCSTNIIEVLQSKAFNPQPVGHLSSQQKKTRFAGFFPGVSMFYSMSVEQDSAEK